MVSKKLDSDPPVKYSAEEKREFARLRRLLVEPNTIWVATIDGRRFLTDLFVLLDVTDSPAIGDWIEDGTYNLKSNLGLVRAVDALMPKVADRISGLGDCDYWEVLPTGFSLRNDHALLVYAIAIRQIPAHGPEPARAEAYRIPFAINAEAWEIFHTENESVVFEHDDKPNHPFRVMAEGKFIAYIVGTVIPEGTKRPCGTNRL